MTSLQKIESDRKNSLKSTGPRTKLGKQRSSQNAGRHGLTAETVVQPYEDPEDYLVFEQSIMVDYDAISAVERALVRRVAGLLWRLRRAAIIETGLLQGNDEAAPTSDDANVVEVNSSIDPWSRGSIEAQTFTERDVRAQRTDPERATSLDMSRCFRRLLACDRGAFDC
jgi:hypothetical protein